MVLATETVSPEAIDKYFHSAIDKESMSEALKVMTEDRMLLTELATACKASLNAYEQAQVSQTKIDENLARAASANTKFWGTGLLQQASV